MANALNQYSAVGSAAPAYGGNGNLAFDGGFTYGYDAESRLTSVKQGMTAVASYTYDAQGRRKTKTVGTTTTVYVTDADNREVLEYDGTTGAVQRWTAYGLGSDDVLNQMEVAAGTRATLLPDIQGSVIGALDSGGDIHRMRPGCLLWRGRQPQLLEPSQSRLLRLPVTEIGDAVRIDDVICGAEHFLEVTAVVAAVTPNPFSTARTLPVTEVTALGKGVPVRLVRDGQPTSRLPGLDLGVSNSARHQGFSKLGNFWGI